MQSVVTGQAPTTPDRKITSGGKQIKTEDNRVFAEDPIMIGFASKGCSGRVLTPSKPLGTLGME